MPFNNSEVVMEIENHSKPNFYDVEYSLTVLFDKRMIKMKSAWFIVNVCEIEMMTFYHLHIHKLQC